MLRLFLSVLLCALSAVPVLAQSTLSTITGVVTDPNGAVMPNVAIEMNVVDKVLPLEKIAEEMVAIVR